MNKENIKDIVEFYRQDEAKHFEETCLEQLSEESKDWYYSLDFSNKEKMKEFLLFCEIHHFTNHIYYKLIKLKYEL